MTVLIVLLLRLLVPLSIFRWPFWGALASMLLDLADFVIFQHFGWSWLAGKGLYQGFDKLFDVYYLSIELWISMRWSEQGLRRTGAWLFVWRLIGVCLFEVTHMETILLLFPNIFENFFLIVAGLKQYSRRINWDRLTTVFYLVVISLVLKLPQEYHLHIHPIQPLQWFLDNHINRYLW